MISTAHASSANGVRVPDASSAPNPAPAPSPAEQRRAAAEKAKLQDAQSALQTLKTLPASAKSTATNMAAQKLEALKQRLKMLMMFGGDPRQIAKEAAQIAKEIGQAAKDYAQAAGGGGSSSSAAADPALDAPAIGDAPETPAKSDAAPTTDVDTPNDAEPPQPGPAAATAAGPPTIQKTSADGSATAPDKPKAVTDGAPTAGRPSGPDAILEEAKQLAARARAILKAAIARAKAEHADPAELQADESRMSDAEKAIRDAEKAMGSDPASAGYAADGPALAAPAAEPAPAISVKA